MSDQQRRSGLGPHLIGQRVVVRRVLRGETGPSGGPALTDLLGILESWADGVTTVRGEDGQVTEISITDIVSGKPVPARPSVRHRISPEAAERRANAGWPPLVSRSLGDWLLRAAAGYSTRANSVLAVGDPGMPTASALVRTEEFYQGHGLPVLAQVVVGSANHGALASAGWVTARPGEEDTLFQIASVAKASRTARSMQPPVVPEVEVEPTVSAHWLAAEPLPSGMEPAARSVLEGPDEVAFVSVYADATAGAPGTRRLAARGRAAYAEDWVGITNVWVTPEERRRGLAVLVFAELLGWAAERGASTAYLQTRGDNPAALALYDRLGFATHHSYRYLTSAIG